MEALRKLTSYLSKLISQGFYGKVTISFERGVIGHIKLEETKKLEELG